MSNSKTIKMDVATIVKHAVKAVVKKKVVYVYDHFNVKRIVSINEFSRYINNDGEIFGLIIENKENLMRQVSNKVNKVNKVINTTSIAGACSDMISKEIDPKITAEVNMLKLTEGIVFEKSSTENIGTPLAYCHNINCTGRDKTNTINEMDATIHELTSNLDELTIKIVAQQMAMKSRWGVEFNYIRPNVTVAGDGYVIDCLSSKWSPIIKRNGSTNHRTVTAFQFKYKNAVAAMAEYSKDLTAFNSLQTAMWDILKERKAIKVAKRELYQMPIDARDSMDSDMINKLTAVGYKLDPKNAKGTALKAKAALVHVVYKFNVDGERTTHCPYCDGLVTLDGQGHQSHMDVTKDDVFFELKSDTYHFGGNHYTIDFNGTIVDSSVITQSQEAIEADFNLDEYTISTETFETNDNYTEDNVSFIGSAELNSYVSSDFNENSMTIEDMDAFWSMAGEQVNDEAIAAYNKTISGHINSAKWAKFRNGMDTLQAACYLSTGSTNDDYRLAGWNADQYAYESSILTECGIDIDFNNMNSYNTFKLNAGKAFDYNMGDSYEYTNMFGGTSSVEDSFYSDAEHMYSNMENYDDITESNGGIYNDKHVGINVDVRPDFKERYIRICDIMRNASNK